MQVTNSLINPETIGFKPDDLKKILANLLRDKEFYEKFGPWMKPAYFSTADPAAPNDAMSEIFEKAKEYYVEFKTLIDKELLKREIEKHFARLKKNEKELPEWKELVDEIFGYSAEDLNTAYYTKEMAGVFQFQEAKLAFHKFIDDCKLQKIFNRIYL